uniref:Uncharacterized protein n=1 Tax=Branchiostoma floridae TaxID=7739 RepID=C3Z8R1_BRAFL|eukprot:XP_002595155.1 hypothetical protein BRAFLDRAFT_67950 [Branchiostoma floridae]
MAACQISKDQANFFGLGTHDSAQFALDSDPTTGESVVSVVYQAASSGRYKDYTATQVPDDYLYSWSPCTPFSEAGSDDPDSCTNMAACQVAKDGTISYGLGTQDSAAFTVTSDPVLGQTVNLVYTMPQGGRYKDYTATQVPDDYLYSWSPCTPFSEAGSDDPDSCTNMAACQVAKDGTISYGLGTQDSAAFTVTSDPVLGQTVNLVYTMPQGGRVAGVILQCTQGATKFSVNGEITVGAYDGVFLILSPCRGSKDYENI